MKGAEEIKSAVARRSDFGQKWADLFFNASNEFMVSVEHLSACLITLVNSKDPNDQQGLELQHHVNDIFTSIIERRYRINRLALLAPHNGSAAKKSASDLFEMINEAWKTKQINIDDLQRKTDEFNQAARKAHAEMIASTK